MLWKLKQIVRVTSRRIGDRKNAYVLVFSPVRLFKTSEYAEGCILGTDSFIFTGTMEIVFFFFKNRERLYRYRARSWPWIAERGKRSFLEEKEFTSVIARWDDVLLQSAKAAGKAVE